MALSRDPRPIFDQLNRILLRNHDDTFNSQPSSENLDRCHGINKENQRCNNNPVKELKDARRETHMGLSVGLDSCQTTEAQSELVQDYVHQLHCHWHWEKAVDKIAQDWTLLVAHDRGQDHDSEAGPDTSPSLELEDTTTIVASSSPSPDTSEESLPGILEVQQPPDPRVAAGLAALARNSRNDGADRSTNDIHLVHLGVASAAGLWRRCSVRDKSPLSKELYQALTPTQHNTAGIVYILKHDQEPGLWKVGWTKHSAMDRKSQPGNCYGVNTSVAYETSSGPFAGAYKAEKLAHAYLAERSLHIKECKHCKRGHKEWFRGPWDEIYSAVRIMEGLMRLPGYELRDGQMKLSSQVHEIFERNWTRSMADLEGLIDDLGANGGNLPLPVSSRHLTSDDVEVTTATIRGLAISEKQSGDKMQRSSLVVVSEVQVSGIREKTANSQATAIELTADVNDDYSPSFASEKGPASPISRALGHKAGKLLATSKDIWSNYAGSFVQGFKEGKEGKGNEGVREGEESEDESAKKAAAEEKSKRSRGGRFSDGLKNMLAAL